MGREDDGYICSSRWMRTSFKRRPQDFKRRVIQRNIPREELLDVEFKWLSLIEDKELGVRYYNLSKHHYGHWILLPDEERISIREKQRLAKLGKKQDPEHIEKCRQTRIGKHYQTEESKQKIGAITSKAMKGKHNSSATEFKSGQETWNKGKSGEQSHMTEVWNKRRQTGKKIANQKLSVDQVISIKEKLLNGAKCAHLAIEFNVTRQTIGDIKTGRRWNSL